MIIKNKFSAICISFTVITIISSTLNFIKGNTMDSHLHLFARFVLCLIGVCSLFIFDLLKNKPAYLVQIIHYISSLALVFLFVCSTQLVEPLAKHAYRDVFLNYTAAYVVFTMVCIIKEKQMAKKEQQVASNNQDI